MDIDNKRSKIKGPIPEDPTIYASVRWPSPATNQYKVYPGRFYILTVFTLFALVQGLAWITFGTIPNESYTSFGLTENNITLLAGNCMYIASMPARRVPGDMH